MTVSPAAAPATANDVTANDVTAIAISSGVRQRATLKWLAPDLAMTFALVTLFSLFYIFGGARTLFGDTDDDRLTF